MKSENNTQQDGGINPQTYYTTLLNYGMAWEFHPWLTGCWKDDKERFINEVMSKFKNANTEN